MEGRAGVISDKWPVSPNQFGQVTAPRFSRSGPVASRALSIPAALAIFLLPCFAPRGAEPPITAKTPQQIELLQQEKSARSPAERKLDSQLVYALHKQRRKSAMVAPGLTVLQPALRFQPDGRVIVDLCANRS